MGGTGSEYGLGYIASGIGAGIGYAVCKYKISLTVPIYQDWVWRLKVTVLLKWIWLIAMPSIASKWSHSRSPYPIPITLIYSLPILLHVMSEQP